MFTGNEDQTITLTAAAAKTKRYRDAQPTTSTPILGQYFSRKLLLDILAQEDCVGIRVYNGLDENNTPDWVVSGVLPNENDIVNGVLGDRSFKSPPFSGATNQLNS